jgi:hypothetical protein
MYENQNVSATKANINGISNDLKTEEEPKPKNKNVLHRFKSYLIALRVWSLSASIIPTVLGEYGNCATST